MQRDKNSKTDYLYGTKNQEYQWGVKYQAYLSLICTLYLDNKISHKVNKNELQINKYTDLKSSDDTSYRFRGNEHYLGIPE